MRLNNIKDSSMRLSARNMCRDEVSRIRAVIRSRATVELTQGTLEEKGRGEKRAYCKKRHTALSVGLFGLERLSICTKTACRVDVKRGGAVLHRYTDVFSRGCPGSGGEVLSSVVYTVGGST